jgi:hypothetical protein
MTHRDRIGHGNARLFHQRDAGGAARNRKAVRFGHFGGGEEFDHGATFSGVGGQRIVSEPQRGIAMPIRLYRTPNAPFSPLKRSAADS